MYIPPFNRIEDRQIINEFIHAHGFATVITNNAGKYWASHLPVLLDESDTGHGTLRSHMARANDQWRHFTPDCEVLCIFHGPHSYISPAWYVDQHTVPTWNYAVVHATGIATLVDDPTALRKIVEDTTAKYESPRVQPWKIALSDDEMDKTLKAIVGFSIQITRIEAKFKLGQNRSKEDQEKMLRELERSPDCSSRELRQFILEHR